MHWNKTFFSLLTNKRKRVCSAINVFELGLRSVCCRSSRASRPQCEYEVCSEQLPPQLCETWHSFWLITQKESVVVVFRISSNLFQLLFSDNDLKIWTSDVRLTSLGPSVLFDKQATATTGWTSDQPFSVQFLLRLPGSHTKVELILDILIQKCYMLCL